ncbi:hypothetical protein PoMZ_11468 [Pyricularia oryzae]|uniref:SET domain-containing protein n=1 Tax=Pyricularia oryzae TaxID=318829 RepID=A0A4P7NKF7_PYROR|nr:hypothetical protein PoMZ_11468 [Pyricularia oryzae]
MEHQAPEDGEQTFQGSYYVMMNRLSPLSVKKPSLPKRPYFSAKFYYLDSSSPAESFSGARTTTDDYVYDDDAESSDSFNSVEFNDRRRDARKQEKVHYSILKDTYLTSLELAMSRLPLNDHRRELLVDDCQSEKEDLPSKLAEAVKLPSAPEADDLAASTDLAQNQQLNLPYRFKDTVKITGQSQVDEHEDQTDTNDVLAHTQDPIDASAMLGAGDSTDVRAPTEHLEHDENTEDVEEEGQKHTDSGPVQEPKSDCTVQINEYFEIRNTSLGGSGSFSRKDLKRGDVILRESFIIRTNSYTMEAQFESLDVVGRRAYLCLHPHWPLNQENLDVMNAICHTNAFNIGGGTAVFPIAARFNHKCSSMSNIDFDYDRRAGLMVFTVKAETVAAGEELTLSYGGNPRTLHERYGFFCQCGGCEGWSQEQADELQKLNWGC